MPQAYSALLSDNLFGHPPGALRLVRISERLITAIEPLVPADVDRVLSGAPGGALDARGKLVLPGLIDCHVHAIATGMLMLSVDLHGVASLAALEAKIREAGVERDIVRLWGLDRSRFPADDIARIDRAWLDALQPAKPLFVKSVEGHSSWFNTAAWRMIGAEAMLDTLGIAGERREDMQRRGYIYGEAYEKLTTPLYDSFTQAERREGMERVIATAQRAGLVGLHCLEGYGEHRKRDFELILELDQRPDIDLTLYCRDNDPQLAKELGVPRFGGCWCLDGAIGAHSAALDEPYADKPESRGELYFSGDEVTKWMESGLREGMQVCVHAIGERALAQALTSLEALAPAYELPALRPRVDHFVLGSPELAVRAAAIGAVSAMQPAFDALWGGASGGYATRLGPERALRANPVGQMISAGLQVAGSSDSYITPLDPLFGLRAALQHHNPAQRVDFDTAVRLFSEQGAAMAREEGWRGRIAPGYQADFTVLDGDRTLEQAAVALTVKGGRVVHEAPAS
jgi:predicted amidohydrolase YtcJ